MRPDPIAVVLLLSALIAACGFIGQYALFSQWYRNEVGRAMMVLAGGIVMLILSGLFLQLLGPDYPFRMQYRSLSYIAINIGLWWQLAILIRAQRRHIAEVIPPQAQDNELVD